ncbi:putative LysR family transcriptional regulator [Nocardia brasiliensis NBRC 14402]|uniref:LysR family transcriptional regulator n=1 Tax=Nocardia brasiliensis TaxID=37326 RepID=UPI000312B005|nr:LysR family transcriptional regulator [Nocardia brasiliensis]ASF13090.1 LysR family transcriptional regulator [Nocardia brasiliensis]GAJ85901.1 putative LysR family transcriptional regulator [Nocardia brasiliensis NBRC 14402]SUB40162.1 HTH-type transcriptional regulator gltC [Nocardia brasiliensis]
MLGEDLEWFITLAELERVGAAAERLHLTQPTLSRMLGRLERRLGVELFDRRGKRIVLNEFGRIYYEQARRAQAELDTAAKSIADLNSPANGVVRLSFLHSFGGWLVPQLVGEFRRGSARITFALRQGPAEMVNDDVLSGTSDLGIVSPRPTMSGIGWRGLLRQRLALAVPADHRLVGRGKVRLDEVSDEDFITMHPGFGMRRIVDQLSAAADLRPRISFEASDLVTVAGLVAAGLGVGVLPEEDPGPANAPRVAGAKAEARLAGPVLIPLADAGATREVGLVWSAATPASGAARRFRDFTEDWAQRRRGIP